MEKSKNKIKECDICGTNATCLCFKCILYFCDSCYKLIHDKQKNANHKKELLDPYMPIDLKCPDHPIIPITLFCLNEKELCCTCCIYKNMHNSHKILELSDEDSLKKENISIDSAKKDFTDIIQKVTDLKNKIENEINSINKLYEKAIDDLTKSFQIKHEKLIKEENDMKENLQNEVTKVKEKLENFWTKINNEIKINERIDQGIKKLNNDNNIIRVLSYVSNINKNQKELNKLLKEPMKSIKFNFKEEQNNIKYEDFYFNGWLYIPKDIEFKDISLHSLNLSWKIEKINDKNVDINKIKYKVEMRKNNDKFTEVYEGNNLNSPVNGLEYGTEYEFRINSNYNDIKGPWSDIKKIKTMEFDSNILKEQKNRNNFLIKILEWCGYKKMQLLYRGTRDGYKPKNFHDKCDNKGPTITLYQNEKCIFGGYNSNSWASNDQWLSSSDCFIFSLVNIYNIEPTKFPRNNNNYAVYHGANYGPYFGGGWDIGSDSGILNNIHSNFPYSYQDTTGKGNSIFTGNTNNNTLEIKEIEVFNLSN